MDSGAKQERRLAMSKEYIGTDSRGNKMYLYHYNVVVYCDHISRKTGDVIKTGVCEVDSSIVRLFTEPLVSGAYIYDEIERRYGKKL